MVFFLLLSIIGLVGCNGLWDFDDDDDTVAPPVVFNVKGAVAPPAGTVTSIRAAVSKKDLRVQAYNIKDEKIGNEVSVNDNLEYEVTFTPKAAEDYYYIKVFATGFDMRVVLGTLKSANAATPITGKTVNPETTAQAWIIKQELSANPTQAPKEPAAVTVDAALVNSFTGAIGTVDIFAKDKLTDIDSNATVAATAISITNGTAASIVKKGTLTLKAALTPSYSTDAVTWAITGGNDPEKVQLNTTTGVVTAVAVGGPVEITATAGNQTAKINITVTNLMPTAISLDQTSLSIGQGSTSQLTVKEILPADADDKTVTWDSSNKTVATVSPTGLVSALTPGTTNITVTTANGISATCAVKVEPVINEVSNVTFDKLVTGAFDQVFVVKIYGAPAGFTTTATKVTVGSAQVDVIKSDALTNDPSETASVVLSINDLGIAPKTIADFQQLTFTPAIPKGSTVKIIVNNVEVAVSNNIPAN